MTGMEKTGEVVLTDDQQEGLALVEEWYYNLGTQIFVLCGYAGTGKTFLIDYIVKKLGLVAGESAAFVAPTGKAASVLVRAGTPATTLHSLIYTREEDIEVDENGEVIATNFLRFVKKEKIDSKIRLIVVDETSMVSDEILRDLLSFGVKCLFCGDPAQLPPVEGRNRLLEMPVVTLTQIVRQERDNPIIRLSERVRAGKLPAFGDYGGGTQVIPRKLFTGSFREELLLSADQVVVGTNRTRSYINREIRSLLGISPERLLPIDGEKLVCTLNDWGKVLDEDGKYHLVNGIIGKCFNVREESDGLGVLDFQPDFLHEITYGLPFDCGVFVEGRYFHGYGDRAYFMQDGTVVHENNYELLRRKKIRREETVCRFEYAYAVTCHKAQGSEYDFVVVLDESNLFGEDGKKWLYTAITRAKKRLVIVR